MSDPRLTRKLRQHLRTDALLGVDAVPRGEARTPPEIPSSPQIPTMSERPTPAATPLTTTRATPRSTATLEPAEKARRLEELDRLEVRGCRRCGLCEGRTQTVFGEGDPDARLMFIGEGPGENEDLQGRPFVGRAGDLLDKQIAAMGLKREQVYIANVVKCRPPQNRTPTPDEAAACYGYLQRQIEIVQPKVIVTMGGPATKTILDTSEGITKIRGVWREYLGLTLRGGEAIPVMPTFHPAYLLRAYTIDNRKKVWSDLQAVMKRLGMG